MSRFTVPFLVVLALAASIASYNMASIIKRRYVVMGGGGVNAKKSTGGGRKVATKVSAEQMKIVREGDVMPVVSRPIDVAARDAKKKKKRMFHTAVTANDSPYSRWQVRIMYYWYKKFKDQPGSEMGGFTRVLHSGKPDNLMDEVPTFVVKPLPEGMDRGYVVLNRPWAFVQWVEKAQIEEEYVFMAEPDHIIVRPIPNLATEYMPAAFSFFYIVPKQNEALLRKWYPASLGPITNIDPIGNSPVIIKKVDLKKIAPLWMNVSIQMKDDPEVDKEFGWVLEMYGYATASAMLGYAHILRRDFQVQPPYDQRLGDTFIIHYTYGNDFTLKGEPMYGKFGEWRFDKRSYSDAPPPRNLTLPPKGTCETVVQLIEKINEASWVLPNWEQT